MGAAADLFLFHIVADIGLAPVAVQGISSDSYLLRVYWNITTAIKVKMFYGFQDAQCMRLLRIVNSLGVHKVRKLLFMPVCHDYA